MGNNNFCLGDAIFSGKNQRFYYHSKRREMDAKIQLTFSTACPKTIKLRVYDLKCTLSFEKITGSRSSNIA